MKNLFKFLLLIVLFLPFSVNAQDQNVEVKKKNEIGIDITGLIDEFTNNDNFFSIYYSTYNLTYKRHFYMFSGRFGVGGRSTFVENGAFDVKRDRLNYRIGVEKSYAINKSWLFYIGLDFTNRISNSYNVFENTAGGWTTYYDVKIYKVGVTPLLGFNLKLHKYVYLQTEALLNVYYENNSTQPKIYQISQDPIAPMPNSSLTSYSNRGIEFDIPDFLVLCFQF